MKHTFLFFLVTISNIYSQQYTLDRCLEMQGGRGFRIIGEKVENNQYNVSFTLTNSERDYGVIHFVMLSFNGTNGNSRIVAFQTLITSKNKQNLINYIGYMGASKYVGKGVVYGEKTRYGNPSMSYYGNIEYNQGDSEFRLMAVHQYKYLGAQTNPSSSYSQDYNNSNASDNYSTNQQSKQEVIVGKTLQDMRREKRASRVAKRRAKRNN